MRRMDRESLRMLLLTYPLLLVVDAFVLRAILPGHWLAQAVHAVVGVLAFVFILRMYRARKNETRQA